MLLFSDVCLSNTLDRRADWQAKFSPPSTTPGATITEIVPNTPLAEAGLLVGDRIIEVDQRPIITAADWYDATDALVGEADVNLRFIRSNKANSITLQFPTVKLESHPGLETIYDDVVSAYGIRQRMIITKPKSIGLSQERTRPAIVVLQGLSCSSIEATPGRSSHWTRLLVDLVQKSGMVVLRIEKPGVGDSEGNCSRTDFKAELAGYQAAIEKFLSMDFIDNTNTVVYGNSMGSVLAPYFANKYDLAGVISDGTYVRTWFEHMLEIERRILEMKGHNQTEITRLMNQAYIPLYYGMLVEKKSYAEIIEQAPLLSQHNYHQPEHMYGRPIKFYHQLQEFDVPGAWQALKVPARIRWGTNDWIMSEYDNDLIIQILKAAGHDDHELYKYPNMDHWLTIHPDYKSSFTGKSGRWEPKMSNQIINWAKDILGR